MAIVRNMWMRNTRQQVAGAVLYNLKGQTIQREKAASVANPRTTAQMDQRVKLANLVNFYRANKAWMAKGAFESKKQTWSDYNAFVSANLGSARIYLSKAQAAAGVCVCDGFIVTKGSLTPVKTLINDGEGNSASFAIQYSASAAPTTFGELSADIIAAHPGIQNGDQLSIIYYRQEGTDDVLYLRVNAQELILNTESTDALTSMFPGWTFNAQGMQYTTPNGVVGLSACFSRTLSGRIMVSDSQVAILNTAAIDAYETASAIQNAIDSYGGSSNNFLDSNTTGLSSAPSGSSGGSGSGDPGDVTP